MKIKSIRIKNFMSIEDAEIDFDKAGLTLLEGENGAGKSSIYEAVYWVLFGKTKRGLTGDAVINNKAGKCCEVKMYFDNYMVYRFRKQTELGTGLKIWQDLGAPAYEWNELTKGTVAETQALIESIIKYSDLTFTKVTYFGQGDVKAFASLTDGELKQVFEQALGLTCLSQYGEQIKKYRNGVERDGMSRRGEIINLESKRGFIQDKIEVLNRAMSESKEKYKADHERFLADIASINTEISNIEARLALGMADRKTKSTELEAAIRKRHDLCKSKDQLTDLYLREQKEYAHEKAQNDLRLVEVQKRLHDIKGAKERLGSHCGECGKTYGEADIAPMMLKAQAAIAAIKAEIEERHPGLFKCEQKIDTIKALLPPLEKAISALDGAKADMARLEEQEKQDEDLKNRIKVLGEKRTTVQNLIIALEAAKVTESYKADIDLEGKKIEAINETINEHIEALKELDSELVGAEMLVEIMSNAGLKSYIFDSITPELNRVISEYMAILNPNIGVEISTVSKTKAGDFKEKFGITVTNTEGADSYEGSSGGERQLVNLAIALGFNSICRLMSEGSVNMLFLDEPLENLDEANSESAIELCQRFAGEIPNVFLVSHSPAIKDLVTGRIQVKKIDGETKIS